MTQHWKYDLSESDEVGNLDSDQQQELARASQDLLVNLHTLLRTTTFHDAQNHATHQVTEKLIDSIDTLLAIEYEINIVYTGTDFMVNERWARMSRQLQDLVQKLGTMLDRCQIGGINITALPSHQDLAQFAQLFHATNPQQQDPFSSLQTQLWRFQVQWLTLSRFEEESHKSIGRLELRTYIRQTYFYAIQIVQQLYLQAEQGKPLKLKTAKRIIQAFVEIFHNPRAQQDIDFLLFLTQVKNCIDYHFNHVVNVAILSIGFAHHLGLKRSTLRDIGIAALLYDIGMVKVPAALKGKRRLTERERLEFEQHPAYAIPVILKTSSIDSAILRAVNVAFSHHLGAQQGGYPQYGRGTQSLASQLIMLIDRYDAMTTSRPHRPQAKSPPAAMAELAMTPSKELNSALVRQFIAWFSPMPLGTVVQLNTGDIGYVVVSREQGRPQNRPVIKLLFRPAGEEAYYIDLMDKDIEGRYLYHIKDILNAHEPRIQRTIIEEIMG